MIGGYQKSHSLQTIHEEEYGLSDIDISEINKYLYISDKFTAKKKQYLEALGIKHIIIAAQELEPYYPNKFNYLHLKLRDAKKQNIYQYFESVCAFLDEAASKNQAVLIHCAYGRSRSCTLAIAFLIKKHKIDYYEALSYVKKKRYSVKPNQGFIEQLKKYSNELLTK